MSSALKTGIQPASKGCKDKTQMSWWPGSSLNVTEGSSCSIRNWLDFKQCLPNFAVSITANSGKAGKALVIIHPQTYSQFTDILYLQLNQPNKLGRKQCQDFALALPARFQPLTKTRTIPSCKKAPAPSHHPAYIKRKGSSKKQRHFLHAPWVQGSLLVGAAGDCSPSQENDLQNAARPRTRQNIPGQRPSSPKWAGFILSRAILSFVTEVEF